MEITFSETNHGRAKLKLYNNNKNLLSPPVIFVLLQTMAYYFFFFFSFLFSSAARQQLERIRQDVLTSGKFSSPVVFNFFRAFLFFFFGLNAFRLSRSGLCCFRPWSFRTVVDCNSSWHISRAFHSRLLGMI